MKKINQTIRDEINQTITTILDVETYEEAKSKSDSISFTDGFNRCLYWMSRLFETASDITDITEAKFNQLISYSFSKDQINSFYIRDVEKYLKLMMINQKKGEKI
jgi:hypothetical protein